MEETKISELRLQQDCYMWFISPKNPIWLINKYRFRDKVLEEMFVLGFVTSTQPTTFKTSATITHISQDMITIGAFNSTNVTSFLLTPVKV